MKIAELLEEVKLGKENYNKLKTSEQIKESFDEDSENYKISDLIGVHRKTLLDENADENILKHLKNAMLKVKSVEDRQEKTNYLSESYSRMKFDSLKTVYNDIISLMENKKVQRNTNKEVLANALGLIRYKIDEMSKLCNVEEQELKKSNEVFQPYIDKEYKLVLESTM